MIIRKSLISADLEEALTSLATCKIFFDYPYERVKNDVRNSYFMLKLTLRKFNGYSFISVRHNLFWLYISEIFEILKAVQIKYARNEE